jgi:hypothetical protein
MAVDGGTDGTSRQGTWLPHMLHAPDREAARHRFDLERNLHDGAAAGMSALALELGLIAMDVEPVLGARFEAAQELLCRAIDELRGIGAALYPPVLVSAGLGPALRALAERRDLRLQLDLPRRDLGAEARSRTGLLVSDHFHTLRPGSTVLVRVRGRRLVRVHITDRQPGRTGLRHHRAVLTCA